MHTTATDSNRHAIWRRLIAGVVALIAVFACPLTPAAESELLNKLPGKPRLANLEIEIWPEYDRPAALVFLKGELAAGAGRTITLRLPVASGGPSAVAQASAAGGNLLNLPFERTDAKDFITLRIQPTERFFHIEFYDKLETGKDKREYRYVWPGDLAADHVTVQVQQPSAATDFAITPAFTDSGAGNDTLTYWKKDVGALPLGKALPVTLRYTKSEARTTKEMLGPQTAAGAEAAVPAVQASPDASTPGSSFNSRTDWIPAAVFVLLGAVGAGYMWRRRRAAARAQGAAGFCVQCGNVLNADDRFCSKCGTAVKERVTV